MRQNVKSGFRAGGRAPFGYRLEHVDTGIGARGPAGAEVAPRGWRRRSADPALPEGARQGAARAAARAQARAAAERVELVGIEWNALTYAGHTVWNVHAERRDGYAPAARSAGRAPSG
jgi:hypothetical protein